MTISAVECVTDEISPNGVSESRLLPGLHTVLAVNKRQFPKSGMKVRADLWRSEDTSQESALWFHCGFQ